MQHLRGYSIRDGGEPGEPVRYIASTEGIKRDGKTIPPSAWRLENFKKNPAALALHNYSSLPIGKATHIEATKDALLADVLFDEADPTASLIAGKVRRGFMPAISVGFEILKQTGNRVDEAELLELSVVPIGSDVDAMAQLRQARSSYRSLHQPRDIDFSALRDATDEEAEQFLRALHEQIVVRPMVEGIIKEEIKQWAAQR